MSDLFTRLVDRTLGKAPVARPLLRSSYAEGGSFEIEESPLTLEEPPVGNSQVPTSSRGNGFLVEGIPHTREVRRPPGADDHPLERIFPAIEEDSETLQGRKPVPLEPVTLKRADESQPEPERLAGDFKERPSEKTWQVEPRQNTLPPPHLVSPSESTTSLTPQAHPNFPDRAPNPVGPPSRLVHASSLPTTSSSLLAGPETPALKPALDAPETSAHPPLASQPPKTGENIFWEPLNPRARDTLRERAVQETPPEIHVTIGRVEVRAISPSPAPTRQISRPRTPSLSLDDYLKQRNENGK